MRRAPAARDARICHGPALSPYRFDERGGHAGVQRPASLYQPAANCRNKRKLACLGISWRLVAEVQAVPMKKQCDETWDAAVRRCGLDPEAERMARELGLHPRTLISVIPNAKERWKSSVSDRVRRLYEKRQASGSRPGRQQPPGTPAMTEPPKVPIPHLRVRVEDEDRWFGDEGPATAWPGDRDEPSWVEDLRILARREQFRLVPLRHRQIP